MLLLRSFTPSFKNNTRENQSIMTIESDIVVIAPFERLSYLSLDRRNICFSPWPLLWQQETHIY